MFRGTDFTNYSETINNGTIYDNNIAVQNISWFEHGVANQASANMDITTSAPVNSTLNISDWTTIEADDGKICDNWKEAQHALFQLANLCFAISFLTPSGFKYHCLFLRSLLLLGFSMFIFWSGLVVCMLDVLGWNVAFFIINICHIIYLGYSTYPVKFHSELEELYIKIFKPLKMTRFEFKLLTKLGKRCNLLKGSVYASEGVTCCGEKFSILLKGRLKVVVNRVFLHHIDPNEFVDSPEYESATNENLSDEKYQVTISAAEDSCVLVWPVDSLDQFLQSNEFCSVIITTLIGKDITHKMYQIQEMLLSRTRDSAVHEAALSRCPSSIINMRSNIVRSPSEHSLQHLCSPDEDFKGIQFSASTFTNSHQSSTKTLPSSNTYETSV